MITPRRTRLHRVADLHAFRLRILEFAHDPDARDSRVIVVPNRAAALQIEKGVGSRFFGDRGKTTPDPFFVTRDELYDRLHERLAPPPRRVTPIEREVIAHACAVRARRASVRQGLVPELLRFYDQLRRQGQAVSRFEELLTDALAGDAEFDRGAERLLQQTRFLAETFRGYERRLDDIGAVDEHRLRECLVARPAADPLQHIVVTIGDWIAEPEGLFPADYDLLSRIGGLTRLDIVATERLLASGFHERIHQWLPGIEEERAGGTTRRPVVLAPDAASERPAYVHRDRSEELGAVARRIHLGSAAATSTAVAYRKPLPYLYLARRTFGRYGIRYASADGFPLAAEPFAAALDLVFDVIESGFTRRALVALLRSPHFAFSDVPRESLSALDRYLSSPYVRFLGGIDRLAELSAGPESPALRSASAALAAAARLAERLRPFTIAERASVHLAALTAFLNESVRPPAGDSSADRRLERGRVAVMRTLASLASAYAAHDDAVLEMGEVISRVRRAIEAQTFVPDESGEATAVRLMDDHAARYAEVDELALVGLIDGEWPDKPTRNIFYPTGLMAALGWPTEKDRRAAAEARFLDLLGSPAVSVTVSMVKLDDEAIVEPSPFLDEIVRAGLSVIEPVPGDTRSSPEYAVVPAELEWTTLRQEAAPHDAPGFHGRTERTDPRAWSVSALETYLGCPFKFFAQHVLALEEDPEDEEILDPRRQGELVHRVFEEFFKEWQRAGRDAITPASLDDARALFATIVEREVTALPEAEAALERTRLLGSPVAPGLGEAVFLMEAERPTPVVGRLLEWPVTGTFRMAVDGVEREVQLRGKTDRIDLLADGTFRVIDYKLGRAPNRARALQLPVYGLCAEQQLRRDRGRPWTLGEAAYIAFREPKRVVPLFSSADDKAEVLSAAQERLITAIDRIAAGEFPPTPDDVFRCETCTYTSVCRKDYVGDV